MGVSYSQSKTLAPSNQFIVACPVFNTDVKIASCFQLRDIVWRGEKPEVRRGCQEAMKCGKCPINIVVKEIIKTGQDPYHADSPRKGAFGKEILDQIRPIMIDPREIEKNPDLSDGERRLLMEINENASPTSVSGPTPRRRKSAPVAMPSIAPAAEDNAAATGDMAAAVNAEIASQEKAP